MDWNEPWHRPHHRIRAVSLDELNPKPGFEVTAIYEDLDGDIWFAARGESSDLRNGMLTTYSTSDGLPSSGIESVGADSTGRLFGLRHPLVVSTG